MFCALLSVEMRELWLWVLRSRVQCLWHSSGLQLSDFASLDRASALKWLVLLEYKLAGQTSQEETRKDTYFLQGATAKVGNLMALWVPSKSKVSPLPFNSNKTSNARLNAWWSNTERGCTQTEWKGQDSFFCRSLESYFLLLPALSLFAFPLSIG